MHQKDFSWWILERSKPAEHFFIIRMCRKRIQELDSRANFVELTVDLNLRCAFHKKTSFGANCLKADKENRVPPIADSMFQMMQDPAAGRHPACGNDDGRISDLV